MSEHPFDVVMDALRARSGRIVRRHDVSGRESYRCLCPAHADTKPSLVVTREGPTVLLYCFGGCTPKGPAKVLDELGLKAAALFGGPRLPREPKRILATYDYIDVNGVQVGQKVRYAPKQFRWRHPDPDAPGGWASGLEGPVGLYRLNDVNEWRDPRLVYLTEGEKSVDRLWEVDLPAVCGPNGCARWLPEWSTDLHRLGVRELVIFADRDQSGIAHAEHVAGISTAIDVRDPIAVRVVHFLDLPQKADVVDYLERHSVDELLALVASTPPWTPDQLDLARLARRRQLIRARVWRHRHPDPVVPRLSGPADHVTQRISEPKPVTQRMSDEEPVTRNAVTLPNVLLSTSQKVVGKKYLRCVTTEDALSDERDPGDRRSRR
jgi:hypothetical protein